MLAGDPLHEGGTKVALLILCPSYQRPREAGLALASFVETIHEDTKIIFPIGIKDSRAYDGLPIIVYPELPMVARTNMAAKALAPKYDYIGWVADDNRFETPGWDTQVIAALEARPGGVVYGNDVVSPGSKPSHVFMDSRIPQALGWFVHPEMRSTFFDDCWEQIGRGLGTLQYLPDIRVNHLYTEHDNSANFMHDMQVYQRWLRHDLDDDLDRIRGALRPRRSPRRSPQVASGRAEGSPI